MKKLHLLLLMTVISCQWIFIFPTFEGTWLYIRSADAQQEQQQTDSGSCITYDSTENAIRIDCEHANLTGVYDQLQDQDLLHKEVGNGNDNGVWVLNAGIVIEEGATLYVNSTDTSWLKIIADGETAYPIVVSGH